MVQWTSSFTIGVTQMISNSEIPPPSSGYSISFPNQPLHACQDSNLKLLVLETSTLPIELHTHYLFYNSSFNKKLTSRFLILTGFFCCRFNGFDHFVNFFFSHEVSTGFEPV